jgi:hypothetical protein
VCCVVAPGVKPATGWHGVGELVVLVGSATEVDDTRAGAVVLGAEDEDDDAVPPPELHADATPTSTATAIVDVVRERRIGAA